MGPTVEAYCKASGGQDFFTSKAEFEAFNARFGEEIRPELEKNRKARRQSEEAARKHYVS
jgi:hypothetical protein